MANTLTNLSIDIAAQKSLNAFTTKLTPFRYFGTDFKIEAGEQGASVIVPRASTATGAKDFVEGTGFEATDFSDAGTSVALDERKYVSWRISTKELQESNQLRLNDIFVQQANALGLTVLGSLWNLIVSKTFTSKQELTNAAAFDADTLVDLSTAANKANWPEMRRSCIINNALLASLLKDKDIQNADAFGDSSANREGQIVRPLFGFNVMSTNAIPTSGTVGSEKLNGFAAHPNAFAIASRVRVPADVTNNARFEILSEPQLGIALGFRYWYDPQLDVTNFALDYTYGMSAVDKSAIIRITLK